MQTLTFNTDIHASPEKIWHVLWDDYNYRQWTAVFMAGSYAVTDWKQGSKVHFLALSGDGMSSLIEENVPFEKMNFRHIGIIRNFIEKEPDEKSKDWIGAMEKYQLIKKGEITNLLVTIDIAETELKFFSETFPRALQIVKEMAETFSIRVNAKINGISKSTVWDLWTNADHIPKWNNASDDWHTPFAKNDLRPGGKFLSRMEAKDGSMGFDFEGTYTDVIEKEKIAYVMADGRKVTVLFTEDQDGVSVIETFEPENENSIELQQQGWQMIMNNFKRYAESKR